MGLMSVSSMTGTLCDNPPSHRAYRAYCVPGSFLSTLCRVHTHCKSQIHMSRSVRSLSRPLHPTVNWSCPTGCHTGIENSACSTLNSSSFPTELLLVLPFCFFIYFRGWLHHPPGCSPSPHHWAHLRPLSLPLPSKPLCLQVLFLQPLKCLNPSTSPPLHSNSSHSGCHLLSLQLNCISSSCLCCTPLLTFILHASQSFLLNCQVPPATPLLTTSPATHSVNT